MRSSVVIIVLVFATMGLLLGFANSVKSSSPSIHVLALTTDKTEYSQGEKITFTATNNGDAKLLFAYGSLQLHLENLDTGERYGVISGQVYNHLDPWQSKTMSWNYARDGELGPGDYVARISTTAAGGPVIRAQTNFAILADA